MRKRNYHVNTGPIRFFQRRISASLKRFLRNFWQCNQYSQQQATKFSQDNQKLRNCEKPVTTSSAPDEREPATGFAFIPYIQDVTEPIKRSLNSHNVKVAQKPFKTLGIFLPNQRILSWKNNEPTPFILFLAVTITTNTSDRPNVSWVHVWKSIKKRLSLAKNKIQLYRSTHA